MDMSAQPRGAQDNHSPPKREPEDLDPWNADDADELVLDRKHLLIVKDGTIRVAESLDDMQRDGKAGGGAKASGTWTRAEHERFLKATELFPKGPWKAIAEMVGTRTVRQTQTHAQKYREKLARRMRGLRNRNGTLQSLPAARPPGAGTSAGQLAMYPTAPLMTPPAHTDIATLAAIASTAPLLQAPPAPTLYYPRTMPPRRMTLPLSADMDSSVMHRLHAAQYPRQHQIEVSMQAVAPQLARSASEFDALSQSSISSAFLGAAGETKEDVPDFDESMDFLMRVYSSDPNQIGAMCAASEPSSASAAEDAASEPLPPPLPPPSPLSSSATAPFARGDEHLRRQATTG